MHVIQLEQIIRGPLLSEVGDGGVNGGEVHGDNLRSVIGVAQVMGTAMTTAARAGLEVAQHTPSEAKAAVTGWMAVVAVTSTPPGAR